LLAEKREVIIKEDSPHKPALCYDFVSKEFYNFYFEEATIYSVSWETTIQNLTESEIEKPIKIRVFSSGGWHYWGNGSEIRHFENSDRQKVKFTLHEPMSNVSKLRLTSDDIVDMFSVICNVQIIAIKTGDNCEEPDSPLYGQHLWNGNDTLTTFKCDDNFNLTSDLPLNCVHGNWIGLQPKCKQFLILNYLILVLITLSNEPTFALFVSFR
jgi:hypothetical protein